MPLWICVTTWWNSCGKCAASVWEFWTIVVKRPCTMRAGIPCPSWKFASCSLNAIHPYCWWKTRGEVRPIGTRVPKIGPRGASFYYRAPRMLWCTW
jgi:hypothetical protein